MGFWYFLILFLGIYFIIKGLLGNKKLSFVFWGILCISFSVFMFSPGSAEIISNIFERN